MPASNYPFLARNQKTEEERQKENIDALWSQLGSSGITGKQSFFTGYGEDNQFQANRPTGILNTNEGPRTVHEAERVDIQPNGEFSVTPASQLGGQENLMQMEEEKNIRGYQFGTPDRQTSITDTYKPYTDRSLQRLESYAGGESPVNKAIREGERERFAGEAASARGALSQEMSQLGITGREAATEQARLGRQIGAQETQMMTDLRKQESEQAFTAARQLPGEAATARQMDIGAQQWQQGFEFDKQRYGDTKAWTDFEYTAQYGSDQDVVDAYREATGKELDPSAVSEIRGYARTKRAQDVTSGYLGLKAQEYNISNSQMEAMAYAIQHGATLDRVNSSFGMDFTPEEFARLSRDFNFEGNVQTASLDAMNIQNAAARLGVDGDRFRTFVDVVNSGGNLEAANMASGLRLSAGQWEDIRRDYSYEGQLQTQNLASARNKVGDEIFDSVRDRIASGVPVEMINTEFNTNLGPNEYMAIRRTTDTGIREYEQNLSAVGMLLQSGDPQNLVTAQNILQNDVFPGVPFSIDQMVKDVGADRAAKALTDLSILASTFGSWEEAQASVEQLRLLDNLNMAPEQAKQLFDSLKINALDEEWNVILKSDAFKSLEPDKQQLVRDTLTATLTGELEYDIRPVYNVTTPDGGFVKSFSNVEDANAFVAQNGNNYSINEAKDYIFKNMASGDTVVVNNGTGEATTLTGETPATTLARIKAEGGDYTESDITAFQQANGRLPYSKADLEAWDQKQYGIQFWNKLEDEYVGGSLTEEGITPKISSEDLNKIVEAHNKNDARANEYYVPTNQANTLFPEGNTMDQALAKWYASGGGGVTNGSSGGYEVDVPEELRNMVNENVGKLITFPDGTPYVILGLTNFSTQGKEGYGPIGNSKYVNNVGGIEVYNTSTKKREVISPFGGKNNVNFITSDIINRGLTDNYSDAQKISNYATQNNVTPEAAAKALGY